MTSEQQIKPGTIRVATYNVLCQAQTSALLVTDWHFLTISHRLKKLKSKLNPMIQEGRIIALQEVDHGIGMMLLTFLTNQKYDVVKTEEENTEDPCSNWITFPRSKYTLIYKHGDIISHRPITNKAIFEHQAFAAARDHPCRLLGVQLQDLESEFVFWVFNTQIKCIFPDLPMILQIDNLKLMIQFRTKGIPFILLGDFNVESSSAVFEFLVQGESKDQIVSESKDPIVTVVFENWKWTNLKLHHARLSRELRPTIQGYSAHSQLQFKGEIDHVFISDPDKMFPSFYYVSPIENDCVLPNEKEPSDHLPVLADFCVCTVKKME